MSLSRRGLLAGLLALPFVAPMARVAQAVKRKLFPVVTVGVGGDVTTLSEAFKCVKPGGTIFLLPGTHELHGPIGPSDENDCGWGTRG